MYAEDGSISLLPNAHSPEACIKTLLCDGWVHFRFRKVVAIPEEQCNQNGFLLWKPNRHPHVYTRSSDGIATLYGPYCSNKDPHGCSNMISMP